MKTGFASARITLVLAFVALSLSIGGVVSWLKLPFYLDSLGIVLATILLGWRYGALSAVFGIAIGFFFVNPCLPFKQPSLEVFRSVEQDPLLSTGSRRVKADKPPEIPHLFRIWNNLEKVCSWRALGPRVVRGPEYADRASHYAAR